MWACPIGIEVYARAGRRPPTPRPDCPECGTPMAFDGSYPRIVRESGVAHRIFIRRAHCTPCGVGDALLPSFVVRRCRDSASAIGAAVLSHLGVELSPLAARMHAGVPERTVRSWRQRFTDQADDVSKHFSALCVEWGGDLPRGTGRTAAHHAIAALGAAWRERRRRAGEATPPAWIVANIVLGGRLLSTRVDVPSMNRPTGIARARGP